MGIPLESLEVEVQADYDVRGEFGVADDVPPGYTGLRYIVRVESPAPESEVIKMARPGRSTESLPRPLFQSTKS